MSMAEELYLNLEFRHRNQDSLIRVLEILKKDESFVEATGPARAEPPGSGFLLNASFQGYDGLSVDVMNGGPQQFLRDLMHAFHPLTIQGSWEIESTCGGTVDGDHCGGGWDAEESRLYLDFSRIPGISYKKAASSAKYVGESCGLGRREAAGGS